MKRISLLLLFISVSILLFAQDNFEEYLQRANMGDAEAQYCLGLCYEEGNGVESDYVKAGYWYKKAAEKGNIKAQTAIGSLYEDGKGVEKNYAEAIYWYKKAAEQGDVKVQIYLGILYYMGKSIDKDYSQAAFWFKKAAEQGDALAQRQIGIMYMNGEGVKNDYAQAAFWFKKAAEQGDKIAQNNLGNLYRNGNGVTKDYTQAVYWYKKSAEQGNDNAQASMGFFYCEGLGVPKDYSKAAYWYKMAAEQGNGDAQASMGFLNYEGLGVPKDYSKAAYWYKMAAEQGRSDAQYNLGLQYAAGKGIDKNLSQAVFWFKKAAEQNDELAQLKLGTLYLYGVGVEADLKLSENWLEKAAKNGNEEAKASLQVVKQRLKNQSENTLYKSSFTSVDVNIPSTGEEKSNYFAVVIGNEKYQDETDVAYAENDANIFMKYMKQTIGVPDKQIRYVSNATLNGIRMAIKWLSQAMEVSGGKGQAYFYFAGHGMPDEKTKTPYLLPVDGMSSDIESAYSLDKLCSELGKMSAHRIIVFLDACFSGATREGKMMASARGVAIKTKPAVPQGNMIVFSATKGDETSYSYNDQHHGLFTYYVLKKLQETGGDVSLGELADYLQKEVSRQSFSEFSKVQTPTVLTSRTLSDDWKNLMIK